MLRDLILANKDVEIQELLESNKELQNYVAAQKTWLWSSFSMWYTNWSPLHLAVSLDQPSVIKLLVRDYGACVNAVHVYGKGSTTPLHRAIELNNIDMAKLLLILGADATLSGSGIDGRRFDSAMNYAQKLQGREEICQALSEQQVV